ncbi:MAG: hypothetical protein FWE14_04875 [Lachnospiraceae bacterium]|nr:hypothetical protein [Lachnospiraceae bacterium]
MRGRTNANNVVDLSKIIRDLGANISTYNVASLGIDKDKITAQNFFIHVTSANATTARNPNNGSGHGSRTINPSRTYNQTTGEVSVSGTSASGSMANEVWVNFIGIQWRLILIA